MRPVQDVFVLLLLASMTTEAKRKSKKKNDIIVMLGNNNSSLTSADPDLSPLQSFGVSVPDDVDTFTDDKHKEPASLKVCNKFCECSVDTNIIECGSMEKLWSLITKGVGHEDSYAKFRVKVSDLTLSTISRRYILEKDAPNGLSKVKNLVLNDFPSLTNIDPMFFERMFPGLIHLTVTEGGNELREITTGYLPKLQDLVVKGDNIAAVRGCNDEEKYCFDPDLMESLELPTLTLLNLGLPDDIGSVVVIPNDAHSTEDGNEHIFDGKVIERLKYKMKAGSDFPVLFEKVIVNEEFDFEMPSMENDQMELVISDIRKNPSLYSRMRIHVNKSDLLFPVYFKTCIECDYDDIYTMLHKSTACAEEKNYLEKYNPDIEDLKTQDITIRGIYIDIDDLIKKVRAFNVKPKYRLTVYTFVAKKPKFKTIDFHIRVFYGMLDGHSSLHQHVSNPNSSAAFSVQDMFGSSLKYAKRLDPLFVQSYSTCIAKLATDYKKNSPTRNLRESTPWQMFANLPNTGIYASGRDKLNNARASAIQSLLTRYMYMLAEDKDTLTKIPYSSIDIQKEYARTIIKSAEAVLEKRHNFSVERKLDDLNDTTAATLKLHLDNKDDAELRLLEIEKEKAKTLVSISVKQKELFQGELDAIQDALNDVKSSYHSLQTQFKNVSEDFADGAEDRDMTSWADIGTEVTSSVISVVSLGKFDMSDITIKPISMSKKILRKLNTLKRLLSSILKTQKKMKKIVKIFRKIEKVYKAKYNTLKTDLREIKSNEIDPVEMSKFSDLVNRFTEGVQTDEDIAEGVLAVYKAKEISSKLELESYTWEDTLFTEEINMINPGEEITTRDIIQWDGVREKIEKLFNHHLLVQLPEAAQYKATMFNMITKGKAMAQLKLDETKLMADIGFADKSYWQYIEEYAALGMRSLEINNAKKARKIDYIDRKAEKEYEAYYDAMEKDLYSQEFIVKMLMIEASHTFCLGYYYDHLDHCPDKYRIDIYTPLEAAITNYRNLVLEESIDKLYTFQPSPQPFDNIAVFIRKEENCNCVQDPFKTLADIDGRKTTSREQKSFRDESIRNCFSDRAQPYNEKDRADVFDKLDNCNMDRLQRFSEENTISFDIPIRFFSLFDRYERVRVDEVKVYLDGVKTRNGKVVMRIENSGILQDRYKGKVFNFLGAPWIRNYEYCGRDIKRNLSEVLDDVPTACLARHFKTLVATSTFKTFEGFYPKPTLFSTWVLSVPKEQNPGLDLTNLKSIQISFSGSLLIGRTDYSTYDNYGNPPVPDVE